MSGNADLILAGVSGGGTGNALCYIGGTGTTAPTNATTALNVGFKDAGWCDESGLSEKVQVETKDVKAFGATSPVRRLKSSQTETFDVVFLEQNLVTLEAYYQLEHGTLTASGTGGVDITTGTPRTSRVSIVFETVDGDNIYRVYIPEAEITPGDKAVTAGDAIKLPVTITAYVNGSGIAVHRFWTLAELAS